MKSSQGGKLFTYMVVVEGYLGSPLGMLFLISIFWKGTTESVISLLYYYRGNNKMLRGQCL